MFFKKTYKKEENNFILKVCALLIHAAKIDENYSIEEEEIIKKTLLSLGAKKDNLDNLVEEAKRYASTLGFNFPDSDWYSKSYELVKDLS